MAKIYLFIYLKTEVCSAPHILTHWRAPIFSQSLTLYVFWIKLWLR